MKYFVRALVLLMSLCPVRLDAADVSDPRFFGKYCEAEPQRLCKTFTVQACLFGGCVSLGTREECVTVENVFAAFDHTETPQGGLVVGSGTFTLDGDQAAFVMAGAVVEHGRMRGSATVPGLGRELGVTRLSSDGLELKVYAHGEKIILRKDVCGNTPPQVTITQFPTAPIRYGRTSFFVGEVRDTEDLPSPSSEFDPERLIWTYDDDGVLEKSASGLRAWTKPAATRTISTLRARRAPVVLPIPIPPTLPPGEHTITFSATDSGGLSAQASVQVTVINDPPKIPTILLPRQGQIFSAGCKNNFLGQAYDVEDGFITGTNLVWSSNIEEVIGHGTGFKGSLDTLGAHVIRLTARDSVGTTSFAETTVNVQSSAGGCAPSVRIVAPPYDQWIGPMGILSGEKITFVGTAEDSEDLPDQLDRRWTRIEINNNGTPIGVPEVLDPDSTSVVEDSVFSVTGANTLYEITFTVTDTDGNTGQDQMRILVLSKPIL